MVYDATDSTSPTTGAMVTAGGLGVAKKLYVGSTGSFNEGIFGNTTSLNPVGTIGEIIYTTATILNANAIEYTTHATTPLTTSWSILCSSPSLTAGLYLVSINGYIRSGTASNTCQWNIGTSETERCVVSIANTSSAINDYIPFSMTRTLRLLSSQQLHVVGICGSTVGNTDSSQSICVVRIG